MSPLVKTKRQANLKDFKLFGAFKGLVEQKNVVFNSFVYQLFFFWHEWTSLKCERNERFKGPRVPKKSNLHSNSSNKLLLVAPPWMK
jgi:hypothetical protein